MAPKRRLSQSQSEASDRSSGSAVAPAATTPVPCWEDYTYERLVDARASSTKKVYYGRVVHFTLPKDNDRGTSKVVQVTLRDQSGELSISLFQELFQRHLATLSQYDAIVRIAGLDVVRAGGKGGGFSGRVSKQTMIETIGEEFEWANEEEKPPDDDSFIAEDLEAAYEMEDASVDLHVYLTSSDVEAEGMLVRGQLMPKRVYVARDFAKKAIAINLMGAYADAPLFAAGFYYLRKVKVYRHVLTAWPNSMVTRAAVDMDFDITGEAKRLD